MSVRLSLIVIVLFLSFGCRSTLTETDRNLIAASKTNKEAVISALDKGANVDAVDENGDGAIYNATALRKLDIVKLLVANGASFQKLRKSMFRETSVLHIASRNGDLELIKFFLDKGMNIDMTVDDETPLLLAVSRNKVDAVKYLIARGADVNGNPKEAGMLPMHEAVKRGNLNMVALLYNAGANIHINQGTYGTPLYQAVISGNIEIAKQLIDLGANVNVVIDATYKHGRYFYDVTPYDMALFEIKWLKQFLVRQPSVLEEIKKYEDLIEYIDFVGGKALAHERHEERIKERARRRKLWGNIGTALGETLKATAVALNSSEFQNAVIQIRQSTSQANAQLPSSNHTRNSNGSTPPENINNDFISSEQTSSRSQHSSSELIAYGEDYNGLEPVAADHGNVDAGLNEILPRESDTNYNLNGNGRDYSVSDSSSDRDRNQISMQYPPEAKVQRPSTRNLSNKTHSQNPPSGHNSVTSERVQKDNEIKFVWVNGVKVKADSYTQSESSAEKMAEVLSSYKAYLALNELCDDRYGSFIEKNTIRVSNVVINQNIRSDDAKYYTGSAEVAGYCKVLSHHRNYSEVPMCATQNSNQPNCAISSPR